MTFSRFLDCPRLNLVHRIAAPRIQLCAVRQSNDDRYFPASPGSQDLPWCSPHAFGALQIQERHHNARSNERP